MEIAAWIKLFEEVNADCAADPERGMQVPLTDVDFYAEQIHNLTEEADYDAALAIAERMAQACA